MVLPTFPEIYYSKIYYILQEAYGCAIRMLNYTKKSCPIPSYERKVVRAMPLHIVLHLELAKPSTITVSENISEKRLQVIKISGGGRIVEELKIHAKEAGIAPPKSESSWPLLETYDDYSDEQKAEIDIAFSDLFSHLRIEQSSTVGNYTIWGEIRIFMQKPNSRNTTGWVWKDSLRWIQVIT